MEQTQHFFFFFFSRKKIKTKKSHNNIYFTAAICPSPWLCSIFPIWGLILPCDMSNVAVQGRARA